MDMAQWTQPDHVEGVDPLLYAVATALVSVASVLYRELRSRAERCEREAGEWRDRYLSMTAIAEIAVTQSERKR